MKKIFQSLIFWITVVSLLPLISLLIPGLPWTHDGPNHVARIANFYQSLSEGNIIPRWAGNLNWGYGHPILMFLYPLPSYVASLFHFIGFSFVDSTKLVFGVSYIASGLTMYVWMSSVFGRRAGFISALLYTFAPYRFVDLYVRGAIGEHAAFIFPPLIFFFLYKIAVAKNSVKQHASSVKYIMGGSLSIAGLILSHNAISLMFMPVIMLYVLYLFIYETKRNFHFLLLTVIVLLFGFALSAFFWIPAYFEGKYTLRDIVTADEILNRFVPWSWFFYSPWNHGEGYEFSKEIGFMHWAIIGSFIFIIQLLRRGEKIFGLIMLTLFVFTLFLMTNMSTPIWDFFPLMQKFQFPWRLLSVAVFIPSVLGAIVIYTLEKNKKIHPYMTPIILLLSLSIVLLTIPMWKPKSFVTEREEYYSGIFDSTTDTGESSPIWSTRSMEYRPTEFVSIIKGKGAIIPSRRNTTKREYTVKAEESVRIAENTLYFPGWKVFVDGKETQIEFQDPAYRGIMTFFVPAGTHSVSIDFRNTKLRTFANIFSFISLSVLFGWFVYGFRMMYTRKNRELRK